MVDDAGRARAVDARGAEHATAIQLLAVSVDQLIDEKQCVFRTGNASLQVSQHRCRATMQLFQPVLERRQARSRPRPRARPE